MSSTNVFQPYAMRKRLLASDRHEKAGEMVLPHKPAYSGKVNSPDMENKSVVVPQIDDSGDDVPELCVLIHLVSDSVGSCSLPNKKLGGKSVGDVRAARHPT